MRVPPWMLSSTYQIYLIEAIRCNREIDKEGLYLRALRDITSGDNSAVFADVADLIENVVSGKLRKKRPDAAVRTLVGLHRLNHNEDAYLNILEFNRRFLNDKGSFALLTVLVLDVMNLDLVRIDTFRGEEAITAAYGERQTRRHKMLGKELQKRLKQFASLDEPGVNEAAERYVEYRFLDLGSLPDYKRRIELEGDSPSDRYLRGWFKKFDKVLGYPSPTLGRPRSRGGRL